MRAFWRLLAAAAATGADLATKAWARQALGGGAIHWLWRPWLSLQLITNRGAMLGLGAGHARAIAALSLVAVAVLVALVLRGGRGTAGLVLLLGGAAGNLASRLTAGGVTDFIHIWFWPGIFNIADVCLRLGIVLALVALLRDGQAPAGPPRV